jgi:putative DNA methylase
MTEPYKKKLIEVAIPLEAINAASSREKSIRHGHPSTLHLWWARRPLAACRAILFAQLVDDPSSHPEKFSSDEAVETERKRLFKIIENLVLWENSTNEEVLESARAEIRHSCGGALPSIYDPFSGGGAISLEAQRLGLVAHGSDLNPIAVMIGKAMIEIPPKFDNQPPVHPEGNKRNHYRYAEGLAEDVKYYGNWMCEKALERIGNLYPRIKLPKEYGGGESTVIAWIWARTVPSPDPAFANVQVPLVRSFDLLTKKGKRAWVEPIIENGNYRFEVRSEALGSTGKAPKGTVNRQGGRCLLSDAAMPFSYIREKAKAGYMKQKLMAIVTENPSGRIYISPDDISSKIALSAKAASRQNFPISHWPGRTNVVEYGMDCFEDLFTERQYIALSTLAELIHDTRDMVRADALEAGLSNDGISLSNGSIGAKAYAEAVSVYLGFIVDKCSDYNSSICSWISQLGAVRNTFARQAIPMVWDFVEVNPFSGKVGSFKSMSVWVEKALRGFVPAASGEVNQLDAQSLLMENNSVVSTDPPYYDNISYADLSDFFYFWLRPTLKDIYPELFGVLATPKTDELIAAPYRNDQGKSAADAFFLSGMQKTISNIATQASSRFPTTIYYAFKQSEIEQEGISSTGWATFLQAVVDAGFSVVGTWPVRTEFSNRPVAAGSNALASSVVLVCRKRELLVGNITRADFIRSLKLELPSAITELQAANIAPADMPQSAIGPGMGVYSRYDAILESDDSRMSVKVALQLINRELSEFLDNIVGEFDEETAFSIKWFELHGLDTNDFGEANKIATPRGISVDDVKHAGIIESSAGKVRILKRNELLDDWDPETDTHITIWECLQYLVREHETNGISFDAIVLLKKMEPKAEAIKDLAYCLYDICANKRKDAREQCRR